MRLNDIGKTVIRPQYIISAYINEGNYSHIGVEAPRETHYSIVITINENGTIEPCYGTNYHMMKQDYDKIADCLVPKVIEYSNKSGWSDSREAIGWDDEKGEVVYAKT